MGGTLATEDAKAFDVFVSYASKEVDYARALVDHLEKDGLRCWIAPRDIALGREYPSEIVKGLRRAKALVVILSRNSRESRHVRAEVERAVNLDHTIFWLRVEEIQPGDSLEYLLSISQGIDAFSGPRDEHWARLSSAIADTPAPPEPVGEKARLAEEPLPLSLFQGWSTRVTRILLYSMLGWALLAFDPFGIGAATQRATERVLANVLSPYYGDGLFRSSDIQPDMAPVRWNEHLTVLLFEDKALQAEGLSWPVSPGFHADVLWDLYQNYTPTAIMVDFLFLDRRAGQEAELERLGKVLQEIDHGGRTKVYLAAYDADPAKSGIVDELRDVATLVPVSWPEVPNFSDASHFYPVGSGAGRVPYFDAGPAHVMYRDLCRSADPKTRDAMACPDRQTFGRYFKDPMLIFWGTAAPPLNWDQSNLDSRFTCRPTQGAVTDRLLSYAAFALTGTSERFPQTCPYPQMILVRDFVDKRFRDLDDVKAAYEKALKPGGPEAPPKIVFYGGDLAGVDDRVDSYTHGRVPAVFTHVMALDNLMTLGRDYVRYGRTTVFQDPFSPIQFFNLALSFAVASVSVFLTELRIAGLRPRRRMAGRAVAAILRSQAGTIVLTVINLAAILPIMGVGAYLAYKSLHLSPANWIGFFGLVVLTRLAESRRMERVLMNFFLKRHYERVWRDN